MTLLTAILALAALNAFYQVFDLWTTSEVLKRKLGHEDNKRMVGIVADYAQFARVKGGLAILCLLIGAAGWQYPEIETLVAIALGALAAYYTPIMWNNWKILRGYK